MSFSYAQKRNIINTLGNDDKWTGIPETKETEPGYSGRFPHRIEFNDRSLQRFAKLVLAKDIGLEPDLKAITTYDQQAMMLQLYQRTTQINNNGHQEKRRPYSDSTDFDGADIATPKKFYMELTHDGFAIMLSTEDRALVREHKPLLDFAKSSKATPIQAAALNTLDEASVIKLIEAGETIDGLETKWQVYIFQADAHTNIVNDAREILTAKLGLEQSSTAFCFNENSALIAVKYGEVESATIAMDRNKQVEMATIKAPSSTLN